MRGCTIRSRLQVLALAGAAITCVPPPSDVEEPASRLDSLLVEGTATYRRGEYDSASHHFEAALSLARERGDLAGEAQATFGLGRVAYGRDEFTLARELVRSALDRQVASGLDDQLFDSFSLLGLIAYYEGLYFESEEWARTALQQAVARGDRANLPKAWNNLALPLLELGKLGEARSLLQRAEPAARQQGNLQHQARILTNLGMLAIRAGELEEAIGLLASARERARAAGDDESALNALGQLGTAFSAMGEPGTAIAHLDSAITIARTRNLPQELASNLELLAEVYRSAGEYPRALRLLEQALELNEELGLRDEAATALRNTAQIHHQLEHHALAQQSLERALAHHEALGARMSEFQDLLLLSRVTADAGDHARAAEWLARAEWIAADLGSARSRVAFVLSAARLSLQRDDATTVLRLLAGIQGDLASSGQDSEWEAHWLAMRAHAQVGALPEAVAAGQLALASVERIRGGISSGVLRTSFLAGREAVYQDLVDLLLRVGRIEEAFATADMARGRVLLDHLATVRTDGEPTVRELAEEERELLQQIEALSNRILRTEASAGGAPTSAMQNELDKLHREAEQVRALYADAVVRADERAAPVLTLLGGGSTSAAQVQATLGPGEALLSYLEGPDRLVIFVVTRDSLHAVHHPVGRSALATRVRVVRELLGNPENSEVTRRALEGLHEVLLADVRRQGLLAGHGSLVIVPHGQLAYVPFAALRDPSTGRYLVEDFALLHLPSAAALPALRHAADSRAASGDPRVSAFAPFPRELPGSATEVNVLASVMDRVRILRGAQATEPAAREAMAGPGIVHLATHGTLNARSPLFSRLELHRGRRGMPDDGQLEVHEVTRLSIGAGLVFLSGCETGLGVAGSTGFHQGEDYTTLARAFLQAGAANVVATLWRVEDAGAAEFAARFYSDLAAMARRGALDRPEILAEVLSRSQREMLRSPRHEAPYYWAGYQLSGSGSGRSLVPLFEARR